MLQQAAGQLRDGPGCLRMPPNVCIVGCQGAAARANQTPEQLQNARETLRNAAQDAPGALLDFL